MVITEFHILGAIILLGALTLIVLGVLNLLGVTKIGADEKGGGTLTIGVMFLIFGSVMAYPFAQLGYSLLMDKK